jgi:nitric oxide reductase NorQ protein
VSIAFDYPDQEKEAQIVVRESTISLSVAEQLVKLGQMTRNLTERGLEEGASTRLLIHAGKLISSGIDPSDACRVTLVQTLSDDEEIQVSLEEMVTSVF